jgi:hypothetical protein
MSRVLLHLLALLLMTACALADPSIGPAPSDSALTWINGYRLKPAPDRVPQIVKALSDMGAMKDPESSGIFVGFVAGVLRANPGRAERLVDKMVFLPFQDQWVLIRAIAYSGLPQWKALLRRVARRLPERQKLINLYLDDELLPIDQLPLEAKKAGMWKRVRSAVTFESYRKPKAPARPKETFATRPELLDTLWGLYFATGEPSPIRRIITLLPWSKERNNIDKLTVGSMAKFTLASNAARDARLLKILRAAAPGQPEEVAPVLAEVIDAAETVDTAPVRKDALVAIELFKRKGPGYKTDAVWWARVGEGAISAGCVVAAVAGQAYLGLPCVVGGALSTGTVHYLGTMD